MKRKVIALLVGVAALSACSEGPTMQTRKDKLAELHVDQVLYGLEHVMTTKGVRKAVLHADTALFRDNDSQVDIRGVRLEFYNETTGAGSGTLTSKTGEYDMKTGAMISRGNAVLKIQGPQGVRTIESQELNYDLQADRIWSEKATVMREGARVVRGSRFESDTRFQNVTVQNARASDKAAGKGGGGIRF